MHPDREGNHHDAHSERCEYPAGYSAHPTVQRSPPVKSMKLEDFKPSLPNLNQAEDPRGAAVAWALLVTGAALIVGILLALNWVLLR